MKNFLRPKLVIFDMDGTLLDTEPIAFAAVRDAAKTMGCELPDEIINSMIGRNQAASRSILLEYFGADFDVERAFELYLENKHAFYMTHGIPVKRGLFEILDKLEERGIKKCVATSTDKKNAVFKLTKAGVAHRFEAIIGGDEVKDGKPAPEIFLKATQVCGFAPAECLVVEDTEAGARGAVAAGIPLVLVPDIAPLCEEVRAMAVAVCEDLIQVAKFF